MSLLACAHMLISCQGNSAGKRKRSTVWRSWAQRGLLALSVLLACFLAYLLMTNATSVTPPTVATPGSINQADAVISRFTFTQTKGERVQWQVEAKQARLFDQEKKAILDHVEVTLFGMRGKELTVEGDEGTLDTETKNFVLLNRAQPLVILTDSGYTIYTNHLAWTDRTREIRTQDPVRIVGNGIEVTGRGLLGHLDTEEFEILEDVHVDLAPLS